MRAIVVRPSISPKKICDAEWTRVRSRIDAMLAHRHPDFFTDLTETGRPMKDKKCPRPEDERSVEDCI